MLKTHPGNGGGVGEKQIQKGSASLEEAIICLM